jgi:hypothetical protein
MVSGRLYVYSGVSPKRKNIAGERFKSRNESDPPILCCSLQRSTV